MATYRGKLIEHVQIKSRKVHKGESVIDVLITLADEMVEIKKKMNELVDEVNKIKMIVEN